MRLRHKSLESGVSSIGYHHSSSSTLTSIARRWNEEDPELLLLWTAQTVDLALNPIHIFQTCERNEGGFKLPALIMEQLKIKGTKFRSHRQNQLDGRSEQGLKGKVALVTGGASGIGEETVRLFADHGAFVVAADVQDELGRQVAASIPSNTVTYQHCDVRDEKQVEETVNFTIQKYGILDILFSNAGILGSFSGILDLDLNKFDNIMAVNVRGVIATVKHAGRAMVERNIRGSIICAASVSSSLAGCGPQAYTVLKHAVLGLVRAACSELGAHGIRVNCVSPYGVATPMTCSPFNSKPEEVEESICSEAVLKGVVLKAKHIAEAALFLASDDSGYVNGLNFVVDGGYGVVKGAFPVTQE
ncbi:hypothetical protein K1719_015435 [Acacia pycnantha]|nr:hypothetical protein K1719_015435 [Acacia pycnantha]